MLTRNPLGRHYKEHVGKPMALLQRNFGQVLRPYKLLATDRTDQARWANDKDIDTSGLPKAPASTPKPEARTPLPSEAWDWTNVGGRSFLGEVVNQGACGSCYSVAVSEMISSRMRILSHNAGKSVATSEMKTSPDRVLKCGIYSQGCQGGFPYLASKFLQESCLEREP